MDFNNQYLAFDLYQELDGTLTESAFNLLEYEARKKVDKYTFNRLVNLTSQIQEVKLCIFKLIGKLSTENNSSIKNESADGYSITFKDRNELEKEYLNIIQDYLSNCKLEDGTPYLYRGTDVC